MPGITGAGDDHCLATLGVRGWNLSKEPASICGSATSREVGIVQDQDPGK